MDVVHSTLQFIQDPNNDYAGHTQAFLVICFFSILWSIVIAVPLGVLSAQNRQIAFLATNISGLGRAIPTIAFFAVALPYLGIGITPAIVAMTVLGIPPILLNTTAGLRGIDPAIIDAARGMGMTRLQMLLRVELPLVLPVIAAGVRTSAVQIVATVPLASIIGAGGYGDYILGGIGVIQYLGPAEALAGALPVIVLALITEYGLAALQRALTPVALRKQRASEIADSAAQGDGKGVVAA